LSPEYIEFRDGITYKNGTAVTLGEIFGIKPDDDGKVRCALHIFSKRPSGFRDGQSVPPDGRYVVTRSMKRQGRGLNRKWLVDERDLQSSA
jgi:hypothetical protein